MTSFTPGPWQLDDGDSGPFSIFDGGGRLLALLEERGRHLPAPQFKDTGYLTWDEHVANARLIAAAPDMLEALKRVVEQADDLARSVGLERIEEADDSALADCRAAVAKAEGRSDE